MDTFAFFLVRSGNTFLSSITLSNPSHNPSFKANNFDSTNIVPLGSLYNDNFRLYFKNSSNEFISHMHHIPMA